MSKKPLQDPLATMRMSLRSATQQGAYNRVLIAYFRANLPLDNLNELVSFIQKNPYTIKRSQGRFGQQVLVLRKDPLLGQSFPSNYNELRAHAILNEVAPEREFAWAAEYLISHADKLSDFIERRKRFYQSYLSGDLSNASSELESIDKNLGKSLWLIKSYIPLLQSQHGLDAQKKFSRLVRDSFSPNTIVPFLTYYISVRNEPSVSPHGFKEKIEGMLSGVDLTDGLSEYFKYHLLGWQEFSLEDLAAILRFEGTSAVIDYYESFIFSLRCAVARGYDQVNDILLQPLTRLLSKTSDQRLYPLLAMIGGSPPEVPVDSLSIKVADEFISGENDKVIGQGRFVVNDNPTDIETQVAMAYAQAIDDTLYTDMPNLSARITRLLNRELGFEEEITSITKESLNFFGSFWSDALLSLIEDETSSDPMPSEGSFSHYAAVGQPGFHPRRIMQLPPNEHQRAYSKLLIQAKPDSPSCKFGNYLAFNDVKCEDEIFSRESLLLLNSYRALGTNEFTLACEQGKELLESKCDIYRRKGIRIICFSLLQLGKIKECSEIIAKFATRKTSWHDNLPIQKSAYEISRSDSQEFEAGLAASIIYHLYSIYYGNKFESELWLSFLEFLRFHQIRKPSEIRGIREKFDLFELIYFLRNVCSESVISLSGILKNSQEVLDERLAVCRLLIDLDEEAAEVYQIEIKSLLRRRLVQRRLKEVEQSKIFVDVESIKRTVQDNLREAYNRYIALRTEGIDENKGITVYVERDENGEISKLVDLKLPSNETNDLLKSIIESLRYEYLLSPEHGLDKYLSVRIRHGTLAAHIRTPVESAYLVTSRSGGAGKYATNSYWMGMLSSEPSRIMQEVDERLAIFSKEFDEFIVEINSWIQVNRESTPTGLFTLHLSSVYMKSIVEKMYTSTTFMDFIETRLKEFDEILEENLQQVRKQILEVAKERCRLMLEDLARDIERIVPDSKASELTNSIWSASIELQVALGRMATWFQRAHKGAGEPFTMQDAIDICEEAVKAVSPQFEVYVKNEQDISLWVPGSYLSSFVDILFIIFQNIARHSVGVKPSAYIELNYSAERIEIEVRNQLQDGYVNDLLLERVANIKSLINDGRKTVLVNSEGGTGFYKLARILSHDLRNEPDLDFGFDKNSFFVRLSLGTRDLKS